MGLTSSRWITIAKTLARPNDQETRLQRPGIALLAAKSLVGVTGFETSDLFVPNYRQCWVVT